MSLSHDQHKDIGVSDDEPEQPKENANNGPANENSRIQRNILERKRKEKIKMFISQLKELVPVDYLPSVKKPVSSNAILETAVAYLKHLKTQNDLLLTNRGSEAQVEEINRLKRELVNVSKERDAYEKMVQCAAAVTPALISQAHNNEVNKSNVAPPPVTSESVSSQLPLLTNTAGKLPGQGLIITQSGQAYFVNDQGIPIAQGIAPPQLLADTLMCKIANPSSSNVSTQSSSPSALVTTASSAGTTAPSANITSSICNGLVAIPGHAGQLPSAIILPNGQILPVVAPNSQNNALGKASATSTVNNCAAVSVSSSSSESVSTPSLPSSIMLLGQQQVMPNGANQSVLDNASQMGRKIMPKPITTIAGMNHISLTALPLPAPSVTVATKPTDPVPVTPASNKKVKKSRQRKSKRSDNSDILAEAAASLFSADSDKAVDNSRVSDMKPNDQTKEASGKADTNREEIGDNTAKNSQKAESLAFDGRSAKHDSSSLHTNQRDPLSNCSPPSKRSRMQQKPKQKKNDGEVTSRHKVDDLAQGTPAIEFDPNDLDMVLDQVENISSQQSSDKPTESPLNPSTFQILNANEDLGPVFSSSLTNTCVSDKSNLLLNDKQPEHKPQVNYASSDSYLIGNLTKTLPVDHRRHINTSQPTAAQDTNANRSSNSELPAASHKPIKENKVLPESLPDSRNMVIANDVSSINNTSVSISKSSVLVKQHEPEAENADVKQTDSAKISNKGRSRLEDEESKKRHFKAATQAAANEGTNKPKVNENSGKNTPSKAEEPAFTKTLPAWSPARESEWYHSRKSGANERKASDLPVVSREQCVTSYADLYQHHQSYQYSQFNALSSSQAVKHIPLTTSSTYQSSTQSQANSFWNDPISGQHHQPAMVSNAMSSSLTMSNHEAHRMLSSPMSNTSHSNAVGGYKAQEHNSKQQATQDVNSVGHAPPKLNSFSTEYLLSKPSEIADSDLPTIGGNRTNQPHMPASDHKILYDKDRSYMSNKLPNVPYNVNLFSSPSQSAFKMHHSSSYPSSATSEDSFMFSLNKLPEQQLRSSSPVKTKAAPSNQPYTLPNQRFLPSSTSHEHMFQHSHHSRTSNDQPPSDRPGSGRKQTVENSMYNLLTDASSFNHAHSQAETYEKQTAAKSKKAKAPAAKPPEFPPMPYNTSPYLGSFQPTRNESSLPTGFFGHSGFQKPVGQQFAIPFQPHGFASLPPNSTQSFSPSPEHLGSSPRFNINNIFKDASSADAFKFASQSQHPQSIYSPRPSNFYANPMSINNILGNTQSAFDMHKSSSTMPAFAHPGFPGFHPSFDFPLSDQQ